MTAEAECLHARFVVNHPFCANKPPSDPVCIINTQRMSDHMGFLLFMGAPGMEWGYENDLHVPQDGKPALIWPPVSCVARLDDRWRTGDFRLPAKCTEALSRRAEKFIKLQAVVGSDEDEEEEAGSSSSSSAEAFEGQNSGGATSQETGESEGVEVSPDPDFVPVEPMNLSEARAVVMSQQPESPEGRRGELCQCVPVKDHFFAYPVKGPCCPHFLPGPFPGPRSLLSFKRSLALKMGYVFRFFMYSEGFEEPICKCGWCFRDWVLQYVDVYALYPDV